MKLFYRGASYDYNPDSTGQNPPARSATSSTNQPHSLIYRGHTYPVNSGEAAPSTPASFKVCTLIYRGATYQVQRQVPAESISLEATRAAALPDCLPVPNTLPRRYLIQHTARVHRANLLKNLYRRMKLAQERGDRKLVQLLEAELQQLTPNRSSPV